MLAGAEAIQAMLGMLSMLQPLVSGVAATFQQLGLQYLFLHKAVAKLGYIVTSLLSGVMQEGFCTATESEESEAGTSLYLYLILATFGAALTCQQDCQPP